MALLEEQGDVGPSRRGSAFFGERERRPSNGHDMLAKKPLSLFALASAVFLFAGASSAKPAGGQRASKTVRERALLDKLPKKLAKKVARGPDATRLRSSRVRFVPKHRGQTRRGQSQGAPHSGSGGSGVATMDVTSWSPQQQGVAGGTLSIHGYGLPVNGVDVYIGATKLVRSASSSTTVSVTLPASPTSGALKVKRTSDGATGTLHTNFEVKQTAAPRAFSFFNDNASGHNSKNAYLLSVLSWYAYDDVLGASSFAQWEEAVQATLPGLGLPAVDCFDHSNIVISTQGCVAANDEVVVVFFRGSQLNAQDWGGNISATAVPVVGWGLGVMVHPGFLNALNAAWSDIRDEVVDKRDSNQKVWLTGHSLGGALATLAAMRLEVELNMNVQGVYTYGAPAVGNGAFAGAYADKGINHQRYTNEHDIVPTMPPSVGMPFGYAHVGNLVEISVSGVVDPESTNEPALGPGDSFDPFHNEYPEHLRAAVSPSSTREHMPLVP